ncbi:uncharacterized protein LOC115711025 [Cannabis sativa]|uniref:uncharacterized protein LOC115711025 n=1 Tax=Cannabis sativa TaxID=3483 RepID=UPI0029CA133D|nr:uncharacterized protein LOC115711025 [Cannabis sativa]
MGQLKAPGPDGMPGRFYRAHWDIVRDDVIGSVIQFFQTGEFVKSLNQTFIVLIPKRGNAQCFDDYRPISLCNFSYKIISKLLANRIKKLLPGIISPSQSAFVPGRWIAENGIIAHEIMDSFKKMKGRRGFVGLKLDMSKAYDRMEWGFLDKALDSFGFGADFRRLIAKCVSSVAFSVLLNGGPLKQFYPERGLRQGDPLSSYLFIIGSEVLSRLMLNSERLGLIKGFSHARNGLPISHLMYADDTFIFCEANKENVLEVKRCLEMYCRNSGQCVNSHKSAVVFSDNVEMGIRGEIKGLLGFRDLNREDKFLGNPILLSGSKVRDFGFLVDKMARRIEGWKSRLLSLAGRSTLIQSVAMSVPIYTMSTFLIPKSICADLDKLVRRFWWKGSDDSNRFLALTNWDSICVPKGWGGLGFKKFEDLNFALVAKLGWNLAAESNTLWCQFFKDKYFRRSCSFWSAPKSNLWSYGARSIMATRDFIRDESCFAIGNGELVDIWHTPWLPGYGWERYVASFNPRICEKGVRASSLLIPGSGEWNREALESWFFPSMVRDALEVPRLSMTATDELFWEAAPDGRFTVKRAFLARIRGRGTLEPLWRSLWKVSGPERIKIFLWRLARDILPFGNRLQRIFGNSSQCVLCNSGEDSASHLFFHCDVAVQVWRSGPWGFCSDSMVFGDNLELVKWLLHPSGTPLGENDLVRFTIYAISLCFVLWRVRNSSFHEGLNPMVTKIQQEISSLVADCSLDRPSSLEMQRSIPAVTEANWRGLWTEVNVFVDAAIREEFGIVAILVLDRSGTVIEAVTAKRKVPTPFVAELEAFYSGCCRILQSGWVNATIFSDCQTLVKSLAAGTSPEWRACGLFQDTRNLLARLSHCQYRWIPRRLNSGAHCLAAWAADHSSFKFFTPREVAPFVATMNHGC